MASRAVSSVVFLLLSLLLCTCALVHSEVVFRRAHPPSGWSMTRRAAPTASVKFMLALKQQNLSELEAKFWSVSDPKSSNYRNFLSIEEITHIVRPKSEDVSVVEDWLLMHGVSSHQIHSFVDSLEIHTTTAVAERLFETHLYEFYHSKWDRTVIRQYGAFSLPSAILQRIDFVIGLTNFPRNRPKRLQRILSSNGAVAADTDFAVVPQTVYGLYGLPPQSSQNASKLTSQGVIEFHGMEYVPSDLQEYSQLLGIPIAAITPDHIVGTPGGVSSPAAAMDIELIAGVNTEAASWLWFEEDSAWLYGFTTHFFNTTDVPQVISLTWSWYEGDQCDVDFGGDECAVLGLGNDGYVNRINAEFQKIALRGISVLVMSGDDGAHSIWDMLCEEHKLLTEYPASSPFVTTVGATQITNGIPLATQPDICTQGGFQCAANGTEVAVSYAVAEFTSGGGFSAIAAIPDYQKAAVQKYLTSGVKLPKSKYYNASNRAIPDVSAVGHKNVIYNADYYSGIGLVSSTESTPQIFAGVVALLNQAAMANSGKPLGFLNPLLYQILVDQPDAFHDITTGDNICTSNGCFPSCEGFYATPGWDPVTGVGTPNYPVLLEYVKKLTKPRSAECSAQVE